jgi:ribosomal protein L11 methyltransferase
MFWMLRIETDDARAEEVAAEALAAGATGAEVKDHDTGAPAGRAIVQAYFTRRETADEARGELGGEIGELADADWAQDWKQHHRPVAVSPRLWVTPSWLAGGAPPGAVEVMIDPQMAFGTGSHETTFLCLQALDAFLAERGARGAAAPAVLDVGTGSGVLSIAAVRLGAARAVGIDNDPVAVRTARKNAELNGVAERCTFTSDGPVRVQGTFDLVIANIFTNTLDELSGAIAGKVAKGGTLHLSGILVHQTEEVRRAYEARGMRQVAVVTRDEWVLLAMEWPR